MRIEDLIKEQREHLDVEEPNAETWEGIRSKWKKDAGSSYTSWWRAAAILFITSSVALLFYSLSLQNKVEQLASLGDISEDYKALESDYQSQIEVLEAGIDLQEVNSNEDLSWVLQEMKTLEEINDLYRRDIGQTPDQNQLVNALIDYYEKKIKLLKKLELEINRTKKISDDEKDDSNTVSI